MLSRCDNFGQTNCHLWTTLISVEVLCLFCIFFGSFGRFLTSLIIRSKEICFATASFTFRVSFLSCSTDTDLNKYFSDVGCGLCCEHKSFTIQSVNNTPCSDTRTQTAVPFWDSLQGERGLLGLRAHWSPRKLYCTEPSARICCIPTA